MRRRKQRPGDEQLLHDETANVAERASALLRLAADGRSDLIPVAKAWLEHDDVLLRSEGINMLLSFWRLEEMVPKVVEMLHHDLDSDVRTMAADALSTFVRRTEAQKDYILGEIVAQLEREDDPISQLSIYEALLDHVLPIDQHPKLPYHFNRDTDVNWDLLAPWRRH